MVLLGMLRWSIILSANLIFTKYFFLLFHLKQFCHCNSSPTNAMAHRMSPEVSLGSFEVSTICISSSSSSLSSFSSPRVFGLTIVIALKTRNTIDKDPDRMFPTLHQLWAEEMPEMISEFCSSSVFSFCFILSLADFDLDMMVIGCKSNNNWWKKF